MLQLVVVKDNFFEATRTIINETYPFLEYFIYQKVISEFSIFYYYEESMGLEKRVLKFLQAFVNFAFFFAISIDQKKNLELVVRVLRIFRIAKLSLFLQKICKLETREFIWMQMSKY